MLFIFLILGIKPKNFNHEKAKRLFSIYFISSYFLSVFSKLPKCILSIEYGL